MWEPKLLGNGGNSEQRQGSPSPFILSSSPLITVTHQWLESDIQKTDIEAQSMPHRATNRTGYSQFFSAFRLFVCHYRAQSNHTLRSQPCLRLKLSGSGSCCRYSSLRSLESFAEASAPSAASPMLSRHYSLTRVAYGAARETRGRGEELTLIKVS